MNFLVQAESVVARGIYVVPTYKGLRHPALANWQDLASNDAQVVKEWGENGYKDYNCVCVAKNDATLSIDIDDLAACKAAGMPAVPDTFAVRSPKGYHLHFLQSDATRMLGNRSIKIGDSKILELKVHNAAVAAPGCVREDGKTYIVYRDLPLVELPEAWVAWITERSNGRRRSSPGSPLRTLHPDFDVEDLANHFDWEFASEFEKDGVLYYVFAECPLADRTHTDQIRSKKTCLIIGSTIGFDCKSCGEEHTYNDLIVHMLEQGYERYPGYIFADEDDAILLKDVGDCGDEVLTADEFVGLVRARLIPELPPYDLTGFAYQWNDTGNSERLLRKYGNIIRYAAGRWYVWSGKFWRQDYYHKVDRMAKYVGREILADSELLPDEKDRKLMARFAIASGDRARRSNMISCASVAPGVVKLPTDFDQDLWVFNCQNGTIDLRTGELKAHSPLDNITKISPVTFDPTATCPQWDKFMLEVMCGNQEMVDFLSMATGYSLTGDTRAQVMFFNHGEGENGKGVFLETLAFIIGDYSYTSAFDTFVYHEKGNRDIRNDLAALVGVRFLSAEESSEGHRLDEALIKQLTGENTITTRFLYQDEFSYKPNFKIWMSSNFRPSIRTTDWGTWRRVKIIPWDFRVTQANRDEQLKSKLRHEAPGILNWMLHGLAGYVSARYKMHFPAIVDNATAEYRISQDVVGQFISARCNLSGKVTVAELYSAFKIWAELSRERHNLTLRKFGDELVKHAGICRAKDKNGSLFQGISLQIVPDDRTLNEMADLL